MTIISLCYKDKLYAICIYNMIWLNYGLCTIKTLLNANEQRFLVKRLVFS